MFVFILSILYIVDYNCSAWLLRMYLCGFLKKKILMILKIFEKCFGLCKMLNNPEIPEGVCRPYLRPSIGVSQYIPHGHLHCLRVNNETLIKSN